MKPVNSDTIALDEPDTPTTNGTDRQPSPPTPIDQLNHHVSSSTHSSEIRSPSPKKANGQTTNFLGLGLPPTTTAQPVVVEFPHLAHYVFSLLATSQASPPRQAPAHPLSVSSSGESDGSDEETPNGERTVELGGEQQTPRKDKGEHVNGSNGSVDKEGLVRRIVELLDNEEEEQVKEVLRPLMGDLAKVSILTSSGTGS